MAKNTARRRVLDMREDEAFSGHLAAETHIMESDRIPEGRKDVHESFWSCVECMCITVSMLNPTNLSASVHL